MNFEYTPRQINSEITNYINESINDLFSLDYEVEGFYVQSELVDLLLEDFPLSLHEKGRQSLINDISKVSADFFEKTKSKKIRIQFIIVVHDKCRLFHVDNNTQRLLCTYYGVGTEWLEESNINREGLGLGDNDNIVKDYSKVRRTNNFDLLLLRGGRFSHKNKGAVHRSPAIEQDSQKRILLKVDEL